jgi:hypothetical protein
MRSSSLWLIGRDAAAGQAELRADKLEHEVKSANNKVRP